ncbi:MAG: cation:proton antiporter, partial [Verrucomicrobiae bacterium]|nr:cation:proton antiporter [Verrucomicrobiae bacterium]
CGILIANSGLADSASGESSREAIQQMADFGVMLLMFVLGMEFSISELRFLRRFSFVGGGLQMAICTGLVLIVAKVSGLSWPAAIVLGVALAMSSTAVSLKTFQDMGLSGTPGARLALGVAIFQDLVIIVFLVLMPLLLGGNHETPLLEELAMLLGRGGVFVLLAWVLAKWVFPNLLHAVARTRSRELFTLTVVGCCIGLAWVGALLQLSLALGAFVAGLVVSESVYKHRIMADIMPIKDVFLTLFFVSVGLMIDLKVALPSWAEILVFTALLMIGKAIFIIGIAYLLGQSNRSALSASFSLCSAGEFSLLLLQKAGGAGLWEPELQQALIASGTVSMALVPGLMRLADPLSTVLDRRGWGNSRARGKVDVSPLTQRVKELSGHAILCGYGPVGRHLNETLLGAGVPTLIIELNADTVHDLMRHGQAVLFADAAHEETWELARVRDASLVAFTFPDASSAAAGLRHVRELNPEVCVLARARFASDQGRLERFGASVVVHDEGEAGRAVAEKALQMASKARGGEVRE